MHELSIATAIIERADELARADGTAAVSKVTVRVGELAGVVPDALGFAFEVARDGTALAGAHLVVEQIPAQAPRKRNPRRRPRPDPPAFRARCRG
ncbi:hydrogenase maturation nickel metallochaperone HypA, partial [Streptomyces sp. NPDC006265]|uniref:hydrogenase maturation nickel metallochaperone HypA/HybF n=1 Tax=Streptomyces sp. NPDC006265 TaxID=3156740 RepID=UPI0033A2DF58